MTLMKWCLHRYFTWYTWFLHAMVFRIAHHTVTVLLNLTLRWTWEWHHMFTVYLLGTLTSISTMLLLGSGSQKRGSERSCLVQRIFAALDLFPLDGMMLFVGGDIISKNTWKMYPRGTSIEPMSTNTGAGRRRCSNDKYICPVYHSQVISLDKQSLKQPANSGIPVKEIPRDSTNVVSPGG